MFVDNNKHHKKEKASFIPQTPENSGNLGAEYQARP